MYTHDLQRGGRMNKVEVADFGPDFGNGIRITKDLQEEVPPQAPLTPIRRPRQMEIYRVS